MLKDLKIAEECAKQIDANITFGKLSKDIYQALTDEGKGKKDFGIVF
jgi:3-hydroxyisobutyrate dehydrogenase-like beta-hydroxyacid dehydrogenase